MSQNSGPFLVSSHGHPAFNPRLPLSSSSSSLKRPGNGPMSIGNSPNTSIGASMNVSSIPSTMRPSNSMGPMKPGTVSMNPMDKSNSLPYSSRYTRKAWPMTRSIHDKNIRGQDDHEPSYLRSTLPTHNVPSDSISSSSFTIEPSADDDEADDIYFSSRHMAAARFQRNQRLLCEVFNEVCIPDLRSNVNVDRILTLRRQVNALKTHRETFEKDLNELEVKHTEKKRKFLEANEKFHNEYVEASSTNLTQEKMNELLQKYEAMEKLQKEKQLLLQQQLQQQQQVVVTVPQTQSSVSTTTVSQPITPVATKTEPIPTVEVPQQQISTPPPPVQTQLPPAQTVPTPLPPSQPVSNPLPPSQSVPTQLPSTQSAQYQAPPSQPQLPPPPPPSIMQQGPPQQPQPTPTPQGYPVMHPGSGYAPASGYGHPQQTQYRPQMNQRSAQYPSNAQWQQQQQQQPQQQQWQSNTYDPRYYNPYPPSAQWSQPQPQQQWSPNQSQQQMSMASQHQQPQQMRGPPQQQSPQMYANGVHYGYGGPPATWNTGAHPSQQYGYPQNPSYDPSLGSTPPSQQQQYYPSSQIHNPPQGYDYGPPSQQQQQQQILPQ